ncbi:Uncharacterised protein [Mycobacteroides abscessus subsp. abscessus]|nr:Uncharacterised protein [Mycobacteroides abscessus subsp. abscessus]
MACIGSTEAISETKLPLDFSAASSTMPWARSTSRACNPLTALGVKSGDTMRRRMRCLGSSMSISRFSR